MKAEVGRGSQVADKQFWERRGAALLWLGLFLAPLAWVVDVGVSYPLVKWECGAHSTALLHVFSVIGAVVAVAGWFISWWCWSRLPAGETDGGTPFDRSRFMAGLGLAANAMFFLLVIANAIPRFLIGPCQQ